MQANFDEARQSQLPALELLINMGYTYLPREEVMRQRGNDASKFLLSEIAFTKLSEINSFEYQDTVHQFSDKNIIATIDELENIPLEGLQDTAKKVYHMIMTNGGKTLRETIGGKTSSHNFRFIDFECPQNNSFHVTAEYPASGKQENIRPDIVCFVNGIPFVVIENKKTGTDVKEALDQMNRNQLPDRCPKLFVYPQILIGSNVEECLYGTTGTPNKFYASWREKWDNENRKDQQEQFERNIQALVREPIPAKLYRQICTDLNGATGGHAQLVERETTAQDRGLYGILQPERLLKLCRSFILFDAGKKKVARYQQFFAVQKIQKRVEQEVASTNGTRREGGIVWHTQGSGKSLTMVLFVKALIEDPHLINPRVIVVTDRIDLDKQISDTFRNCNLKKEVIQAKTGKHLLKLIKDQNPAVVTSLVHKFETAAGSRSGFIDDDKNLFVLIDEAHRTQGGIANAEMRRTIPNACFIAFTGTPLLKDEKSRNQFGDFIDKYTIDDALKDDVILPLIYEGRFVPMSQNKEKVDRHFERITKTLGMTDQKELQRYVNSKVIKSNPHRIAEIAYDIEDHYFFNFHKSGLKAQLVAPSKFSAILFQNYLEQGEIIRSAVIISESTVEDDETDDRKRKVTDFLKKIAADHKGLESYEKEVIESFKYNPEGIELLIVVDKLLTGFDAPRNTVLYLTKELRDHNLLQAIARVNRLFENAERPKTSGFIIDYSENAENINNAMELFSNFDKEDVKRALIDTTEKIRELEESYDAIETLLKGVENKKDSESYIQYLSDEQKRDQFYKEFRTFVKNLDECLSLHDFAGTFKSLDTYKKELKRFAELRKSAQLKYADRQDLKEYKTQLVKILDEYIDADEVEPLTEQININDKEAFDEALEGLGSDKSRAEAIAAQMSRTIHEKAEKDPEFFKRMSDKIEKILQEMRAGKLADAAALKRM
ncbi:HsdR family type I site-specific deoxyribonuclease, partial [Patescibacteria group bacterium]|nr:HsdR family type I site-specific deoxyribonuclease [Patescibacteria group bacterium]